MDNSPLNNEDVVERLDRLYQLYGDPNQERAINE